MNSSRKCSRSLDALPMVLVTIPIRSWKSSDLSIRNTNSTMLIPAKNAYLSSAPAIPFTPSSSTRKSYSAWLLVRSLRATA
eukprot:448870-Hanusia_phi.AAC.1